MGVSDECAVGCCVSIAVDLGPSRREGAGSVLVGGSAGIMVNCCRVCDASDGEREREGLRGEHSMKECVTQKNVIGRRELYREAEGGDDQLT